MRNFPEFVNIVLLSGAALCLGQANPGSPTSMELERQKRSFFVSGRVVLDDGTSPNERVAIERVCPTRTRREAYTDSTGAFSFNLGGETDVTQDATISNSFEGYRSPASAPNSPSAVPATTPGVQGSSLSQREAMRCFLRASLPGFRSDSLPLDTLRLVGNTSVGTIVLHRMVKSERARVSTTTLQAPPAARKAYEHARQAVRKNRALDAVGELQKAIDLDPKFAEALVQLGEIYAQQGRTEEAERLFTQAIAADPKFSPAYFDLAPIAGEKRDWKRMAEVSDQGLALDAYAYPAGYYFNAVAYYWLDDLDKAEKSAQTARKLDPAHLVPNAELILSDILVRRNDYAGAAEQLRSFLKFSPNSPEALRARDLLSRIESKLASVPPLTPR